VIGAVVQEELLVQSVMGVEFLHIIMLILQIAMFPVICAMEREVIVVITVIDLIGMMKVGQENCGSMKLMIKPLKIFIMTKKKIQLTVKLDTVKLGKEISRELFPMSSMVGKIQQTKKQYDRKQNKKIQTNFKQILM